MVRSLALVLLALFIFFTPWENMVLLEGIGTMARLTGVVAFSVGLVAVLQIRRVAVAPFHVWAGLFVALAIASLFWTITAEGTLARAGTYLQLLAMAWLIGQVVENGRDVRLLLSAYVFGAWVAAAGTVYSFSRGIEAFYGRFAAPGFDPNDLAYILALGIPFAWYLRSRAVGITKWVYSVYPAVALLTVLLTASRGGAVAAIIGFTLLLIDARPHWFAIGAAVILSILGLGRDLLPLPSEGLARLATFGAELTGGTLNLRTVIWEKGLAIFPTAPFFGVGAGAFGEAVSLRLGYEWSAHNALVSILVEQGLIGLGLFLTLFVVVGIGITKMPKAERRLWVVAFAVLAVALMLVNWEWRKQTWVLLALAAAHRSALRGDQGLSNDPGYGNHGRSVTE